jgi:predicted glycosyltransferase
MSSTSHDAARVMFCCNEAVGLGHVRRTLTVGQYLRMHTSLNTQLIVTGSPVAQNFPLPPGCDYVKLPSVAKRAPHEFESLSLPVPFHQILEMRRDMILSAARYFRPDLLIVDHLAAGIEGEIVPTLRYLKEHAPRTRLVLGLRDIVDEASRVRRTWRSTRIYELLEELYDLILVYGDPEVYDVVQEYAIPSRAAAKMRYVGYLRREPGARSSEQVRAELRMQTDRLVVVTAGGGADGYGLFRAALEALRLRSRPADFDCLLVTGPLLSAAEREHLADLAGECPGVHVVSFTPDMTSYIGAADVVVAMSGYNTVCEILSFERPAILVPRVSPSQEQLIRAEALSRRRPFRMIHPDELTPRRLLAELTCLLEHAHGDQGGVAMEGLPAIAAELMAILPRSNGYAPGALAERPALEAVLQ